MWAIRESPLRSVLFYMGVVVDMVDAVAVVTLAAGAVTELQLRIRYICPTADGTAVGIRTFGLGNGCLVRACTGEGNHFGSLLFLCFLSEQPAGIGAPCEGE